MQLEKLLQLDNEVRDALNVGVHRWQIAKKSLAEQEAMAEQSMATAARELETQLAHMQAELKKAQQAASAAEEAHAEADRDVDRKEREIALLRGEVPAADGTTTTGGADVGGKGVAFAASSVGAFDWIMRRFQPAGPRPSRISRRPSSRRRVRGQEDVPVALPPVQQDLSA